MHELSKASSSHFKIVRSCLPSAQLALIISFSHYLLLVLHMTRRNLSVESFGSLAKLVEQEQANTKMGQDINDVESTAFTHEDFGPEQIDQKGEDNIVSVLYAGKTKKGFGKRDFLQQDD
jgi:hypothetical protein